MHVQLLSLEIENFKGTKYARYEFGKETNIYGANASGKTTIFDALWWLLFNKDSNGSEKFSIRPLDSNGKMIDNVAIKVNGNFEIDGKEVEICKEQKQKWTKKRGTEAAEFIGNVNSFEVDGYPKTESEYKKFISDLIGEETFKLLTNPMYFTSLKWKDQRAILMKFVSGRNDIQLAKEFGGYDELLVELEKAPSTEDIQKKYSKSMNELKKKLDEYPVRIDELNKNLVSLEETIKTKKDYYNGLEKVSNDAAEMIIKRSEIKVKMAELKAKLENDLVLKKVEAKGLIEGLNIVSSNISNEIEDMEALISISDANIETTKKAINTYKTALMTAEKLELNEDSFVCPYCGKTYPEDKKETIKKEFYKKKELELKTIADKVLSLEKELKHIEEEKSNRENELKQFKEKYKLNDKKLEKAMADFMKLPNVVDLSSNAEYVALEDELNKIGSLETINNSIEISKAETELKILTDDHKTIKNRISVLTMEQRETAQKIANCEKMIYLLEQFIKEKMNKISFEINDNFKMVNFILFKTQINSGLAETCECEYNGVPFNSLNAAAKIQCGLDIIRSLQELFDIYAPVFIDNRESCTVIPKMDCQLVNMYVSPKDTVIRTEVTNG